MTRQIIFLRHGVTAPQQQRRYCGQLDPPLAPEGRRQIAGLRERRVWPSVVVCSDLRRCLETAALLLPRRSPRIRPAWREIDFGAWEGLTWEETGCDAPERLRHPDFCFPQGETLARLQTRVERGLQEVLQIPADDCLVIAHQGSIAVALTLLLKLPLHSIWDFHLPCGACRAVDFSSNGWELQSEEALTPRGVA